MATERCAGRLLSDGRAGRPRFPGWEQPRRGPLVASGPFAAAKLGRGRRRRRRDERAAMASDLEERVRAAFRDKLKLMKIPEKENDFLPSACLLLEKQRELSTVTQALQAQKEEFQVKMENLHHRRQELERKEQQLKEAILKFDKFLKENDAKKSRALHKAGEEQRQAAQRGAEAERLRQEIARLLEVKQKLQLRLAKHKIFPMYLQQVVEKSEQFQEVPELIARFQALSATHAALTQREQVAREALEEARASLQQFLEESGNESLQLTNRVAELQARLEQARTRAHELESSWVCIQSTAASKTLELGQIKLATLNLYQLVAKHRKLPAGVPQEDTEAQLDAVQLCIVDLTDILASFRKGEPSLARQPEPPTAPHAEAGPS